MMNNSNMSPRNVYSTVVFSVCYIEFPGRFDVKSTAFKCSSDSCSCIIPPSLTTVLDNGYWPANPRSLNILFSQNLFVLWDSMQKRMPGCSESSFIRALEAFSHSKGRVCRKVEFMWPKEKYVVSKFPYLIWFLASKIPDHKPNLLSEIFRKHVSIQYRCLF